MAHRSRSAHSRSFHHREEANRESDIPHPSPADRRDLESLVKTNWEDKVQKPLAQVTDHTADQIHSVRDWIFDS